MKIYFLLPLLILLSCGKQGSGKLHQVTETSFAKFVNEKPLPADPNLTLDKSIVNHSYPIQIALYNDGNFYYDLPNLGDGVGTWRSSGGKIKLLSKRSLFDMHIEIQGNDEQTSSVSIQFADRFGPNTLNMSNVNI